MEKLMKLIIPIIMFFSLSTAWADKASECTRLWQLERETGCPAMPSDSVGSTVPLTVTPRENFIINSEFGPSKCVIDENIEKEKQVLKKECNECIKERKADLAEKFLTGTCNPECGPCPKNEVLRRCTYKGEVHYSVK